MEDALDAYLVGACQHLLQIEDLESESNRKQPLFDILPSEQKYEFIYAVAKDILDRYVMIADGKCFKTKTFVIKILKNCMFI